MLIRYFHCPKCNKDFSIKGFWRWIFYAPFHAFHFLEWQDYRYMKCPHCQQKSLITWYAAERADCAGHVHQIR